MFLAALPVFGGSVAMAAAAQASPGADLAGLTTPPNATLASAPGTLIEAKALDGAPDGASAFRILYWSTGLDGLPRQVSGMVVIPSGRPPPGGRPVVAWAHPTTGVVERCAPSLAGARFQMISGLRDMVGRGWIVAATDYPGLGTAGPHPYLVGVSEARAVLDSVRAARQIPGASAGARFVVWGHSQGGQAALFTGLLAKEYAPDLTLLGVAAAAPATELGALLSADLSSIGGKNLAAMTLWSWSQVYGAPISQVVEPAAMPAVDRLANACIESIHDILERRRLSRGIATSFLSVPDLAQRQPWAALLAQNTPGPLPPDLPVFLAQGEADKLVRPEITREFARSLCADGSAVTLLVLPKIRHAFIAAKSAKAATAWMAGRFAGSPAPNECESF